MIDWQPGMPPEIKRAYLVSFAGNDARIAYMAVRQGCWTLCDSPYEQANSYVDCRFWAEINYPKDTKNEKETSQVPQS